MLSFYKQQSYFSQIVSKKAKITISFFMKNSKNKNIILGFSFMYLVSVYPTNRTKQNLLQKARQNLRAYKIWGLWVCWQLHADWKIDLHCDDLLCSMNHKKHPFSCIIASFSSPPFFFITFPPAAAVAPTAAVHLEYPEHPGLAHWIPCGGWFNPPARSAWFDQESTSNDFSKGAEGLAQHPDP